MRQKCLHCHCEARTVREDKREGYVQPEILLLDIVILSVTLTSQYPNRAETLVERKYTLLSEREGNIWGNLFTSH